VISQSPRPSPSPIAAPVVAQTSVDAATSTIAELENIYNISKIKSKTGIQYDKIIVLQ